MSWDIFVQDMPEGLTNVDRWPADFAPKVLGDRDHIIRRIREVAPDADFSDPAWGRIERREFSIEVDLGPEDVCEGFAFHVRGGDGAVGVIADILEHLNLRAIDPQDEDSGLFSREAALASLAAWRAYRDRAVGDPRG